MDSADNSPLQTPVTPRRRRQPIPLRLSSIGIDPSNLIGKVLTRVRRSQNHPALTLDFADNTTFQVLVDGYDPIHRGIPKTLEMNSSLDPLLDAVNAEQPVNLVVSDCTSVQLTDKAFECRNVESRWNQSHLGIAFKFGEEPRWHCVWATLAEYDEQMGACTFRSYDDVYLDRLERSPRKDRSRSPRKNRSCSPRKKGPAERERW